MCAQLFAQQDRQPDVWVMSGAPTATVVYLSLQTTINYSSGSPDTLPPNTPAVIYGTSDTAFDRSLDVWVPFTVRASRILSIIKESLLSTLTVDYVAMARVELHGIKPYQPEPYLASGGVGTAGQSTTVIPTTAGGERVFALGTLPSGWQTPGYDDSSWAVSVAQTEAGTVTAYGTPPPGSAWVTYLDGFAPDNQLWLLRKTFALPVGLPSSATFTYKVDDFLLELWVNGSAVAVPGYGGLGGPAVTLSIPPSVLVPGATNVVALKLSNGGHPAGPTAVAFSLAVGGAPTGGVPDPGGHEGDLLYFHAGAWVDLPIGTSGQELTVVGSDPAWATPPAGGSVTSVALTMPGEFSVAGSPITTSGTLTVSKASQAAHTVYAGPASGSAAPSFRALAGADLPAAAGAGGHIHAHGKFL